MLVWARKPYILRVLQLIQALIKISETSSSLTSSIVIAQVVFFLLAIPFLLSWMVFWVLRYLQNHLFKLQRQTWFDSEKVLECVLFLMFCFLFSRDKIKLIVDPDNLKHLSFFLKQPNFIQMKI